MTNKKAFEITGKINVEDICKFDDDENIWYRWQNPDYAIEGEYTQSWGMIYSSAEEARENAEEWGLTKDEAVLSGKSCMPTLQEIKKWANEFSKTDVLLVFKGYDTYETGHDGEYVAEYDEPVAVYSMQDTLSFIDEQGFNDDNFDYYEWYRKNQK